MKICSVTDCENKFKAKGYCLKHYHRYISSSINEGKQCIVDDCLKIRIGAKKYCSMHQSRISRHGSIDGSGMRRGTQPKVYRKCMAKDCEIDSDKQQIIKGLCNKHYIIKRKGKIFEICHDNL